MGAKYYKYGNGGDINQVKNRLIDSNHEYFNDLKTLLESCERPYLKNIKIKYYAFDDRLNNNVFMVIGDYQKHKEQFVCYFIEE